MRRVFAVLAIGATAACSVADFEVDQPIAEQEVQGSPLPGPISGLFPFPLSLDIGAKIKAMHTGPIGGVHLTRLTIAITPTDAPSGDADDFSFIDSVAVFVSSTQQGSTLPKRQIATLTSPGPVATADFDVDSTVDLDPYINEGSMIDTTSSGHAPPDDTTFDGDGTFTVHPL